MKFVKPSQYFENWADMFIECNRQRKESDSNFIMLLVVVLIISPLCLLGLRPSDEDDSDV